jgi:hypothetical protein
MPLIEGYGHDAFVKNIRTLRRENKTRAVKRSLRQILAIAFATSRRSAKRAGVNPAWLRRASRGRGRVRVHHRRSR